MDIKLGLFHKLYGVLWRLNLSVIIILFLYSPQTNGQSRENVIIAVEDLRFAIESKDLVIKLDSFLPSSRQLWVEFMLSKNITQYSIKLIFDFIKKDNRTLNLMKHDFDGCKLLEMAYSKVTAIRVTRAELMRTSNLPQKCPLLANKLYFVRNYTINAKDYPGLIPAMRWLVTLHFYIGKKLQGKMFMRGEVSKP